MGLGRDIVFFIDRLQTEVQTRNVINTKLGIQRSNSRICPPPIEFCEVNITAI